MTSGSKSSSAAGACGARKDSSPDQGARAAALLAALAAVSASASEQVGTLARTEGSVWCLRGGGETKLGADAESGAPGRQGRQGSILRTVRGRAGARDFDNGDQLDVGPSTALGSSWDRDAADAVTEVRLDFGKVRGMSRRAAALAAR